MKVLVRGRTDVPAVVTIGTWDPLLPCHLRLVGQICHYATRKGMAPMVVLITPPPGVFGFGRARYPIHTDADTRVDLLLQEGLGAVAVTRFTRKDFDGTIADFIDALTRNVPVAELWLGEKQSLGRNQRGNRRAVLQACLERDIELKIVPDSGAKERQREVRDFLQLGRLTPAEELVGRPPLVRRPRRGRPLRFAWPTGVYQAVPLDEPAGEPRGEAVQVALREGKRGMATLDWPDREMRYLAFVSGPGDLAPDEVAARVAPLMAGRNFE